MGVFAVDTHPSDCAEDNECDFTAEPQASIFNSEPNAPQSLCIKKYSDGKRLIRKCLIKAEIEGRFSTRCYQVDPSSGGKRSRSGRDEEKTSSSASGKRSRNSHEEDPMQ